MKEDVTIVHGEISIVDYYTINGNKCECGLDISHQLKIHGIEIDVCPRCLSNIGHCVIDALE